jgi:hypothetical protein
VLSWGAAPLLFALPDPSAPGSAAPESSAPVPAGASVAVRFEYTAPAECPNETTFVERVRERSQHGHFAADGELARTFVVSVAVDERGATARVDFVDSDGSSVFRRVRGETCEEAVSGIALVTALAIDGRATPEEPETPAATASAVPPPPPVAPPAQQPPRAQLAPPETRAAAARETVRESALSFSAGLGAGYASHKGPSGSPTFDAFFGARLADDGPSARASVWHFRSEVTNAGREARFRGYGSRLELCPLAFGSSWWFVEPCLGADGGVLLASGVESAAIAEPRESARGWWDVLALARVGTLVSGWLLLEAQGELALPLVSDRYGFGEPPVDPNVFEVGSVGVSGRGGLGFRFR